MTHKPCLAALAAALSLALALPATAHHSRAAFQLDVKSEMKAKITKVRWTNPHVFLVGNVVNDKGQVEEWTFEGHSISGLSHAGWAKDTVKEGDELLLVVNKHRETDKHFALMDHVVLPTGRIVYSVGQPPVDPNVPKPPVKASTDFSGNWKYVFPGTPEQVRQRILLGTPAPAKEGPYTAKAKAQVAAYRETDNPTLRCIPATLPYLLMAVYEYKWIRYSDRIVIEKEQFNESTRVIHLKGKAPPLNSKPSVMGYSVGHFEADGTLVVETSGFSAAPWGNGAGIDSGPQKKIVERYQLTHGGLNLSLSYTQEDPEYFTQARTGQGAFAKVPDFNFAKNPPCDLKAAQQHLAYDK
jgi:hypothetical protein